MAWLFVSCLPLGFRLTHCDRDKDQKGKRRTRRQDDGKRRRRLKRQNAGKRGADGCAAHLQETEQRGCQPGLTSKRMECDRSTEWIDQPHAEQIQRDGHGEGHEGRCCGEREHEEAASESDEEADHADGTLSPAMSQTWREKPRHEDDQNCRRERQSELKGGKAKLAHQDGGRRREEGVKPADDKAH